jgi:hypothetical protein
VPDGFSPEISGGIKQDLKPLQKLDVIGDHTGKRRQHFHDVDAIVNTSFLQNDMKSKLSLVLDANIPIERDYIWWRILGGTSETTYNFTVWLLQHNSVDARQRNQREQEKMLVGDIEFVKRINYTVVAFLERLHTGNQQFKECGITSGVDGNTIKGTFEFPSTGINGKLGAI